MLLTERENHASESATGEGQSDDWGSCWLDDYDIDATLTCMDVYFDDTKIVARKAEIATSEVPELVRES